MMEPPRKAHDLPPSRVRLAARHPSQNVQIVKDATQAPLLIHHSELACMAVDERAQGFSHGGMLRNGRRIERDSPHRSTLRHGDGRWNRSYQEWMHGLGLRPGMAIARINRQGLA